MTEYLNYFIGNMDQRMIIQHGLLLLCALGLGLTTLGFVNIALSFLLKSAKSYDLPRVKLKIPYRSYQINKHDITGALVGAVFMFLLSWGTDSFFKMTFIGFFLGYLVTMFARKQYLNIQKWTKQRDMVILFESVELYMRAGLSMNSALQAAKLLTPSLKKAINKTLVYWPSGTEKALEAFKEEVDLPEADILASLLAQIERAGIENLEGIVRREAERLQRMHEAAENAQISRRPTYMMLYRALPLIACMGMITGVLFMHVSKTLQSIGIGF